MSTKRLREIVAVFSSVGLTALKDKRKPLDDLTAPQKLRQAFEKLGSSFVKIGQILSTRSDLLPEAYIKELSKLQSDVQPCLKMLLCLLFKQSLKNRLIGSFSGFQMSLWPAVPLLRRIWPSFIPVRKL